MLYESIREKAWQANLQLPKLKLVLFTFGNASAADAHQGVFAIKPSGVPYDKLTPKDMVVVDFDGKTVDGTLRPSSDTLTHAVLYRHWAKIGGIVHTHSTYATAWAQTQLPIPILGTTHADHLTVDIPCAPVMSDELIQKNYEESTGHQIIQHFEQQGLSYKDVEMVLVANHAPFTWGKDVDKAVYNSAVLEQLAKMAWIGHSVRPELPRLKTALIKKHYERKHGDQAYYGQTDQ